jgi:hypothetical protein
MLKEIQKIAAFDRFLIETDSPTHNAKFHPIFYMCLIVLHAYKSTVIMKKKHGHL